MILPVAVLLAGMGMMGFLYARNTLLEQWGENAVLKLQRAAHHVDMKLSRPKEWLRMFHQLAGNPHAETLRADIIEQLRSTEIVARVDVVWQGGPAADVSDSDSPHEVSDHRMPMHAEFHNLQITAPRYDALVKNKTVSLISDIEDSIGVVKGRIEVVLRFDELIEAIQPSGWLQSDRAYLVNEEGRILAGTIADGRQTLGETGNLLETDILRELQQRNSGTIMGGGFSLAEVSGFYRLQEAPWYLVMFAPKGKILRSIIRFQVYFFGISITFILFILVLIRLVTGHTVAAIKEISIAVTRVAGGDYHVRIPVKSRDEVGKLGQDFNLMTDQLEERIRLKQAMGLAMEVQQNLLPKTDPLTPGLDIAGRIIYCDETGGDYYDYIYPSFPDSGKLDVIVGDVTGHGIPSALLMTSVRAFLRQRTSMPGSLDRIVADVNRQIAADVADSGHFVTLFYARIDRPNMKMQWLRAGHEPAMVYHAAEDRFETLSGKGMPLGTFSSTHFEEHERFLRPGEIIVITTDGIRETRNPEDLLFGETALREVVRRNAGRSAGEILAAAIERLNDFRAGKEQEDDVTLVIIKVTA